jgi:mannose-6-phosphate isomerase-like protein (cupin superfamily)
MQVQPFFPSQTYAYLGTDGQSTAVPGGDQFWSLPPDAIQRYGRGWLISEYEFIEDWKTWEMHPHADEFVYLLSGELDMHLDGPNGVQILAMKDSGAVLVPKGIWHTAKVKRPCRMLHVTMGEGTEIRPVEPNSLAKSS